VRRGLIKVNGDTHKSVELGISAADGLLSAVVSTSTAVKEMQSVLVRAMSLGKTYMTVMGSQVRPMRPIIPVKSTPKRVAAVLTAEEV